MSLVTCRRHGKSPGGVVCRHIPDGSARVAVRIPPQPGEEGSDYLCGDCVRHPWDLQVGNGDLVTACMWCARKGTQHMQVFDLAEYAKSNP